MRIVIGAAAGNIGRRVSEQVIQAGAEAVLLVRNPAKLAPGLAAQARVEAVDIAAAPAVVAASRGADALFWLVPPAPAGANWEQWYAVVAAAGAAAVRENRIPRVVLISSLGAGMAPGLGTVSYVGEAEARLNETGANVVHLRAGYFMENFLLQTNAIRTQGVVAWPYAEDHDIPFISVDDIGDVAARYLLGAEWAGQWTHNLMGPTNLTLPECVALIAEQWGQPVRYQCQSFAETEQSLAQLGVEVQVRQELAALYRALGDPNGPYATPRTPEAVTPTTFPEFIQRKLLPVLLN